MAKPDPETRNLLAGEYVLGTLRGAARRRFERLRDRDAKYCADADEWEKRLNLLVEAMPGIQPPDSLWDGIERRIAPPTPIRSIWRSASFWRGFSVVATAAAAAFLFLFIQTQQPPAPQIPSQVAVLSDKESKPAWVVRTDFAEHRVAVETLRPQDQPQGTSYELWMIPGANQAPVSLGLIVPKGTATITLSDPQFAVLKSAAALAVSLEPAGGSPTGAPTGPVLYQGALVPSQT